MRLLVVFLVSLSPLLEAVEPPGVDASFRETDTCLPAAVGFSDESHGWFSDQCGSIFETHDAGAWWSKIEGRPPIDYGHIARFAFLSPAIGVALPMEKGSVLITSDRGRTWRTVALPVALEPRTLEAVEGHFWVCGRLGEVLRSADGGQSWRVLASPLTQGCSALSFVDHQTGWASGAKGHLFETRDGGASWKSIPTPTIDDVEAIRWTRNLGWLVTRSGLLRTLDGGQHWSAVSLAKLETDLVYPVKDELGRTHFRFNDGVSIEDSIPVLKDETAPWGNDGLVSWRSERSRLRFVRGRERMQSGSVFTRRGTPGREQLRGVTKLSNTQWYGWSTAYIYHSEDAGKRWFVVGDTPTGAKRIVFVDRRSAIAETLNGWSRSHNGGRMWEPSAGTKWDRFEMDSASGVQAFNPLGCLRDARSGTVELKFGFRGCRVMVENILRMKWNDDSVRVSGQDDHLWNKKKFSSTTSLEKARDLIRRMTSATDQGLVPSEGNATNRSFAKITWSCGDSAAQTASFETGDSAPPEILGGAAARSGRIESSEYAHALALSEAGEAALESFRRLRPAR